MALIAGVAATRRQTYQKKWLGSCEGLWRVSNSTRQRIIPRACPLTLMDQVGSLGASASASIMRQLSKPFQRPRRVGKL